MENNSKGPSLINSKIHSSVFEKDPTVGSFMSKLITPLGRSSSSNNKTNLPTSHELQPLMRDTMQRANDADNAFEVLPDLEMVAQIAISSVLSSKDLITTTLVYDTGTCDLPFELKNTLIKLVSEHFNNGYKLPSYLYDILYEVMFKSGAYPVAIIPESSVDTLIASGREGIAKETIQEKLTDKFNVKGILGSPEDRPDSPVGSLGLESLTGVTAPLTDETRRIDIEKDAHNGELIDSKRILADIHLTDNAEILKLPKVQLALTKNKIKTTYNTGWAAATNALKNRVATESGSQEGQLEYGEGTAGDGNLSDFDNSIYSDATYGIRPIEEMPNATQAKRPNYGHPLVQHLPAESVIPVHVPGDFKTHVGYLVMLDKLGNPVNRHDLMNTTQAWSWISGDASSQLMKDAAQGLGYGKGQQEKWTVSKLTDCYADLVDRKLKNSLANGIYGESVTITRPQEVYRIMMARALAKKQTQILYIPSEQMTYFAFDYTDAGIGRSLTDKNKIITAGRAAIMFATLQASVLNATRNMEYTIELTAEDREPEKTIDDAQQRIMQAYGGRIPFTGSIDDMSAYFTNAGITFNIEGNDYYPSTKISVSDNTPDYKVPDRTVEEDLAKRNYRGFGVDPDLIMSPGSIEFATQVLSKDLIATKQTCQRQEKVAPLITHFCRTYTTSSGTLMNEIAEEILKYYTNGETKMKEGELGHHINEFVNSIEVSLPPPDMSLLASQMNAYEDQDSAIENIVKSFIDDDFLSSSGLELDVRSAQAMVGNYLRRNWFRKNGVLPDLIELLDDTEQRADFVKSIADDNVNIATFLMMATKRAKSRLTTVSKNMGDDGETIPEETDSGSEFENSDGGESDEFSDDVSTDLGGDDDIDGAADDVTDDTEEEAVEPEEETTSDDDASLDGDLDLNNL